MKIVILTEFKSSQKCFATKYYLFEKYNIDCEIAILETFIKELYTDDTIFIPFDIKSSEKCHNLNYKYCLVNNHYIYKLLDDKRKVNSIIDTLQIKKIPTFLNENYDFDSLKKFCEENDEYKFIAKNVATFGQMILKYFQKKNY